MTQKILIVEDDADIAAIERDYLERDGLAVEIAADGQTGLARGLSGEFALILLDLMLPKLDGFEVCRCLREKLDIPILMVTARQEDVDKIRGLGLGADDYIEKPFGTSELLARIRTAIRHTRTPLDNNEIAQSGKFTVKDLTIDYDKHHVLIGDQDVHLTLNEFKIVALLGKYAGKVLTYDYLIKQIWGPKAKADNQILRVNMANIRRKIEKNPASPEYIFTEIGVGYRMLENNE